MPTVRRVADLVVLPSVLEAGAARVAVERDLSPADRAALLTARSATSKASIEDCRRCDSRLHLLIAELTGSPSLFVWQSNYVLR